MRNQCEVCLPLPVLILVHLPDIVTLYQECCYLGQLYSGDMLTWARIVPLPPLHEQKKTSQLAGQNTLVACVDNEKVIYWFEVPVQLS